MADKWKLKSNNKSMKQMRRLQNEQELIRLTLADAMSSSKRRITIFAGHFPLYYSDDGAYVAINKWGAFTHYSLEMGCQIGKEMLNLGKEVKFMLLADDVNYEDFGENAEFGASHKKGMRRRFYKAHSGSDANLPREFDRIFSLHGITLDHILRQDQGKEGRRDCLISSEKTLRNQSSSKESNQCAKSYRAFLENPRMFNRDTDYLISFVPDRCTSNVCNRVLESGIPELYASHIFMQTESSLLQITKVNSIWADWEIFYRKDAPGVFHNL